MVYGLYITEEILYIFDVGFCGRVYSLDVYFVAADLILACDSVAERLYVHDLVLGDLKSNMLMTPDGGVLRANCY